MGIGTPHIVKSCVPYRIRLLFHNVSQSQLRLFDCPCKFTCSAAKCDPGLGVNLNGALMSPKNIFICYRRDDAEGYAGRLFDRLNYRFSKRVFMDVTGIRPGADFSRVIQDTVGSCHVLIAVIGRDWITLKDGATNQRRLDLDNDYVRREIATALSRNITVIPVLVRGAEMPTSDLLPPDLAPLSLRNALEITDGDFDHDVQRLIEAVEIAFGEPRPLPPAPIQPRSKNSCLVFALGAIVAVGAVVFLVVMLTLLTDSNQNTNGGEGPTPQPTFTFQTPEPPPTQQPAVVNQFPVGRWTLSRQTADGDEGVDIDIDIFANGTYRSNEGHAGRYVSNESELELENWGRIYFREQNGNALVGDGTLNNITYPFITLTPR